MTSYQRFLLQTGTALHVTDATFEFLVASNGDLFAIKKSGTGTNSTEVHVLSRASNYQTFSLQTGTALHETDATFAFVLAPNRDLVAVKKLNTGTNRTEVHVLSASSGYQAFSKQTGTGLHETDDSFEFCMAQNRDLVAIKKRSTGTNSTEVHILSADTNYDTFSLQTGTALHETDATFEFCLAPNRDVVAIKKSSTGTSSTEVHILSAASKYQGFSLQTGSVLHETDGTFAFDVGHFNSDGNLDVYAIKKSNTGTTSTEVHVLSGRQLEVIRMHAKILTAPNIALSTMMTAANQVFGAYGLRLDLVTTENLPPDWKFIVQTGTALHPTDGTFEFLVALNGDLIAIKKSGTGTNSTEVHVLSAASGYQAFSLQTGTPLHETDGTFSFALAPNRDIFAFKKANTGTNSTEVHVLSAGSSYQQFVKQTGTALHETDATFALLVASNRDVIAIKKSATGTGTTEVHILSASSNYQTFSLQTGSALHQTDGTFEFAVGNFNGSSSRDVYAFKKAATGTNTTECHVLSGANNYQSFLSQTGTALHPTDATFQIAIGPGGSIYAIKKSATGTGSTELHVQQAVMLNDLDVGSCAGGTTSEQDELFSRRNNVQGNEIVVYFVRSTVPPLNGCASHPSGRPGAVVTQIGSRWTMAHEIGHVVGLSHVNNSDRLMTGNGTNNITNPPPDLIESELDTMFSSSLTIPS